VDDLAKWEYTECRETPDEETDVRGFFLNLFVMSQHFFPQKHFLRHVCDTCRTCSGFRKKCVSVRQVYIIQFLLLVCVYLDGGRPSSDSLTRKPGDQQVHELLVGPLLVMGLPQNEGVGVGDADQTEEQLLVPELGTADLLDGVHTPHLVLKIDTTHVEVVGGDDVRTTEEDRNLGTSFVLHATSGDVLREGGVALCGDHGDLVVVVPDKTPDTRHR
jgi:hypothetical protein